ncbi:hypothetical protein XHV734_5016 [Xanthomonas hortorum pv. vitians]|nr:hypothetical protein XHV734_5016 [Xanthomonas hortorum pv. vitians]
MDIRTRSVQGGSDPSNAGTEHLGMPNPTVHPCVRAPALRDDLQRGRCTAGAATTQVAP